MLSARAQVSLATRPVGAGSLASEPPGKAKRSNLGLSGGVLPRREERDNDACQEEQGYIRPQEFPFG